LKLVVLALVLSSCSTFTDTISELREDSDCDYIDPDPFLGPVEDKHIRFCAHLCLSGSRVAKVIREAETEYARCQCKSGTEFRVTRLKFGKKQ